MNRPALLEQTQVLNYLGQVFFRQNELERAEAYQMNSLKLAEQFGDRRGAHLAGYHLGKVKFRRGNMEEAEQIYRGLVYLAQEIPWSRGEGWSAHRLAEVLIHRGQLEEAEHWLYCSEHVANQYKEPQMQAHVRFGRAQFERKRAQLQQAHESIESARKYAQEALELYQRLEARMNVEEVQAFLAELDR